MAEFTSKRLNLRFIIPDKITVAQQLKFRSRIWRAGDRDDDYIRYWHGATAVIQEWTSIEQNGDGEYKPFDLIPSVVDYDLALLDTETDPRLADVIFWVANETAGHMANLGHVKKNS